MSSQRKLRVSPFGLYIDWREPPLAARSEIKVELGPAAHRRMLHCTHQSMRCRRKAMEAWESHAPPVRMLLH
jgi:hypothetical protein